MQQMTPGNTMVRVSLLRRPRTLFSSSSSSAQRPAYELLQLHAGIRQPRVSPAAIEDVRFSQQQWQR